MFGAIERSTGKIFLSTVESRDAMTLGNLIRDFISLTATIYSDEWPAYISYFSNEGTQTHRTVNHTRNFVNPDNPEVHTQTIENLWGILKKWLSKKELKIREYMKLYLAEFVLRRNSRGISNFEFFKLIINLLVGFKQE